MFQVELFQREEGEQALQIPTGLKRERSALLFEHLKSLGIAEGTTNASLVALKLGRCMGFMEGAGMEGLMYLLGAMEFGDKDIYKGASMVLVKLTPKFQEEIVPHLARLYDSAEDRVAAISRGEGEFGEEEKQALLISTQAIKAGAISCLKTLGDVAVQILSEDPVNAPLLEELKG